MEHCMEHCIDSVHVKSLNNGCSIMAAISGASILTGHYLAADQCMVVCWRTS